LTQPSVTSVAAFIGAIVALMTIIITKEQTVFEFRQAGINDLRDDLAEAISAESMLWVILHQPEERGSPEDMNREWARFGAALTRVDRRLNLAQEEVVSIARTLLKMEWEPGRTGQGSQTYVVRNTKCATRAHSCNDDVASSLRGNPRMKPSPPTKRKRPRFPPASAAIPWRQCNYDAATRGFHRSKTKVPACRACQQSAGKVSSLSGAWTRLPVGARAGLPGEAHAVPVLQRRRAGPERLAAPAYKDLTFHVGNASCISTSIGDLLRLGSNCDPRHSVSCAEQAALRWAAVLLSTRPRENLTEP
jgi:hypothetical protein